MMISYQVGLISDGNAVGKAAVAATAIGGILSKLRNGCSVKAPLERESVWSKVSRFELFGGASSVLGAIYCGICLLRVGIIWFGTSACCCCSWCYRPCYCFCLGLTFGSGFASLSSRLTLELEGILCCLWRSWCCLRMVPLQACSHYFLEGIFCG